MLKEIFRRSCHHDDSSNKRKNEIVFVHGPSGVGKSKLVEESMRAHVFEVEDGYFVMGKFDQFSGSCRPFSAITDLLTDLVMMMIDQDEETELLRRENNLFSSKLLRTLIPNLSQLLPSEGETPPVVVEDEFFPNGHTFQQLKSACVQFLDTVSQFRPLLLYFDDLQWADEYSLEIIKAIACNNPSQRSSLLVICSLRDESVVDGEEYSIISQLPELLESMFSQEELLHRLKVTDIQLTNFSVDDINRMLQDATCLDEQTMFPLANVIFNKTHGHPHSIVEFLDLLQVNGFLYLNDSSKQIEWNIDQIVSETDVTDNVLDLVVRRAARLPTTAQQILEVAAYLGYHFDVGLLCRVVNSEYIVVETADDDKESIDQLVGNAMQDAIQQGMIEIRPQKSEMKWAHDTIQNAFYSIAVGAKRELLHYRIGRALKNEETLSDEILFLVAHHLNASASHIESLEERIELARINVDASILASSKAAFDSASTYLKSGLDLFDNKESLWNDHREVALDLYNRLCYVEYCTGNFDVCRDLFQMILSKARRSPESTATATYACMDSLAAQGNFENAISLGISALRDLGEPTPQRPNLAHVCVELFRARRALRGKTDDELLSLPKMRSERKKAALKLLCQICGYAYISIKQEEFLLAYAGLRMINLTMKYGKSPWTCYVYATAGVIDVVFDKYDSGYRFGKLAEALMETDPSSAIAVPRTLVVLHAIVMHWREDLQKTALENLRAHDLAAQNGDVDMSFMAAIGAAGASFQSGVPLFEVERQIRAFVQHSRDFRQESSTNLMLPFFQLVLNLQGHFEENVLTLTGEAMNELILMDELVNIRHDLAIFIMHNCKLKLAYLFGSHEMMLEEIPLVRDKVKKTSYGHYSRYDVEFYLALSYFSLYRKRRKRKYLRKGRALTKTFKTYVNQGVTNCESAYAILKAEKNTITNQRNKRKVAELFVRAAQTARERQFLHHEALANELASIYMIREEDYTEARGFVASALQLYDRWGGSAKRSSLEDVLADLMPRSLSADPYFRQMNETGCRVDLAHPVDFP